MESTSTSEPEISAASLIDEHLRENPIRMAPWEITHFFEDENLVDEAFLDFSVERLESETPEFVENHKEKIEELKKIALLIVPMMDKIPLLTLIGLLRETTSKAESFPYLPDFPKQPATRLLDHIFRDNTLSIEEKKMEYEQIAKSTPRVLEHLISWRNHVKEYVSGLRKFHEKYECELSEEQVASIQQILDRSLQTLPNIEAKIRQKQAEILDETSEFEQFYRILSKEPKYCEMGSRVARSQIQRIYNETNVDLRRFVARMAIEYEDGMEEDEEVLEKERDEEEETVALPKVDAEEKEGTGEDKEKPMSARKKDNERKGNGGKTTKTDFRRNQPSSSTPFFANNRRSRQSTAAAAAPSFSVEESRNTIVDRQGGPTPKRQRRNVRFNC